MDEEHAKSKSWNEIRVLAEEWEPDFEGLYNFPTVARLSMVARLEIGEGRLLKAGLLPLHIGRDAVPRFAAPGSAEHAAVVDYLTAVTGEAGLNASYRQGADMVEVFAG